MRSSKYQRTQVCIYTCMTLFVLLDGGVINSTERYLSVAMVLTMEQVSCGAF